MRLFDWFRRAPPEFALATPRDAPKLAKLHAASFRRGWSEDEFERLLLDRNVLAHRATISGGLCGFVISRLAADEAEILSVAVASPQRGRGLAGRLLDLHLRTLAGRGVRAVFLEVDEGNAAAKRLYARRQFREVGRRQAYYAGPIGPSGALVLRRELA